jgi:uncharacterized membrane protein YidH (DUF202 family)
MLAGMVRVNRPWRLVLELRSALAAAVATAAFGLVSSPVWEISGAISTIRLWIATVVSLIAIVGWLILNHGLWQYPKTTDPRERRQIRLYNAATLSTLAIGVLVSYVVLLGGNFVTGWFVVVPEVFARDKPTARFRRPFPARLVGYLAGDHRRRPRVRTGVHRHGAQRDLGLPLPKAP